jgi:diguanylate cyclase (GGDEF)-like protein
MSTRRARLLVRHGFSWQWLGYLGLGAMASAAFLARRHGAVAEVLYPAIAASTVVAVMLGVRWHRPATSLPWILLGTGAAMFAVADGIWMQYVSSPGGTAPFPSLADGFYLGAYPFLALGLISLARQRSGRAAWSDLADGLIVALSVGDLAWLFVIHPYLEASGLTSLQLAVSLAYPVVDLAVLYAAARLVMVVGGGVPAFLLLVGSLLALLTADAAFYTGLAATGAPYGGDLSYVGWLASYLLLGAAALHPSMARLTTPRASGEPSMGRLRIVGFMALLLLGPAIAVYYVVVGGGDAVDAAVVTTVSAVLALLILVRLAGVTSFAQVKARELDRQAVTLKEALTEQVDLQRQMTHQAFHDPLTDLANRALLNERLAHAVSRRGGSATTALLMLDLDAFKAVNDTLGHPCGDQLLIEVARRLAGVVRRGDTVARLGGDEFAVLLEDTSPAAARSVAERVVDAVREPMILQGRQLHVSISIGVLLSCEDVTPEEAVRDADVALYCAKSAGRNQIQVFEPSMRHAAIQRATLESDLRTALARGEFCLHYQPIYDLTSGSLVGVEALLRWDHPGRGVVPPGQFIPIAEETGLMVAIGRWVLRTACRQVVEWRGRYPGTDNLRLSVNLSGRELMDANLVDVVSEALVAAELPADALVLEITESVLVSRIDKAAETLHRLRRLGAAIAIDDFGTGYSSLAYLRHLPVDLVKIDHSFMREEHAPEDDWALTRGIVRLSESMHLPAVAEGVETREQAARLAEFHCQLAQGYYFAPPMAATAFDELLADGARTAGRQSR